MEIDSDAPEFNDVRNKICRALAGGIMNSWKARDFAGAIGFLGEERDASIPLNSAKNVDSPVKRAGIIFDWAIKNGRVEEFFVAGRQLPSDAARQMGEAERAWREYVAARK